MSAQQPGHVGASRSRAESALCAAAVVGAPISAVESRSQSGDFELLVAEVGDELEGAAEGGGLVWVVLPVLLVDDGVSVAGVGYIKALYPFVWAAGMVGTVHLADRIGRKIPIVSGMLLQAVGLAIITVGISDALVAGLSGAFLLGAGTSLVYPTLLAAISDGTHPDWRAAALGVFRFWRDSGYAIGALIGGITAAIS